MVQQPVKFGKYLLLERISVGGMAEVFKAKYSGVEGFQKILAIKRILPSLTEDAEFIRMFIDEAKIAGQLNHANICQIYELGKINRHHFIAMEYIWGKDLLQISNRYKKMRQTMPFSQACYALAKACEALDYAHKKRDAHGRPMNIIHRDVTPQNILVSYEGEVKLIDFGIAKARDRSAKTAAGVLKGKFGYMSPEQVRGLPLDRRSDIFSLGILLFETCTGHRLFDGETDFVVLEKVRNVEVPRPSSLNPKIPRKLEAVILKALQRDPEDRFQWAGDLHKALQSFMMTQRPVYSAKLMSQWMGKSFAADLRRERIALERWFKNDEDGGGPAATSPRRRQPTIRHKAVSPPPPPRKAAPPPQPEPASAEPEDDGATTIDDEGRMAPLKPVYDEPKPAPSAPPPSPDPSYEAEEEKEPLGDQSTVMLDEGENPMEAIHAQSTQMLDEDDPNKPDMQAVLNQIAASKEDEAPQALAGGAGTSPPDSADAPASPAPTAGPGGLAPVSSPGLSPAESLPAPGAGGLGAPSDPGSPLSSTLNTGDPKAAVDPTAMALAAPPKKRRILRDLAVALPVAAAFFALGAFAMKLRGSEPKKTPPVKGSIVLALSPQASAKVSLNSKETSQVSAGSMAVFKGITQGSHVIKVEAEGYKPAELRVTVKKGEVTTKTVTLEKLRQPSQLSLTIEPAEADPVVRVDGKPVKDLKNPVPLPFDKKIKVEALAFGFKDYVKTFPATADKKIPLKIRLEKANKPMIQVDSKPSQAQVFLDGEQKCKTPCRLNDLPFKKKLALKLSKDGYLKQSWKFFFKRGQPGKDLLVTLKPDPQAQAREAPDPREEPEVAERPRDSGSSRSRNKSRRTRRKRDRPRETSRTRPRPRDRTRPRPRTADCDSRCKSKTKGCLWVNSQPRARVYVDGRNTGRNTPIFGGRALKLRPGYHRITFVTSKGKKHKYGVRIKACQVSRLVRRLK